MTVKGIEVWSALIGFAWIVLRLGADSFVLRHELSVSKKDGKCYHCFFGYNLAKESTERNRAMETSYQCSRYGIQIGEKAKSWIAKSFVCYVLHHSFGCNEPAILLFTGSVTRLSYLSWWAEYSLQLKFVLEFSESIPLC
jgi:hypothetical protein